MLYYHHNGDRWMPVRRKTNDLAGGGRRWETTRNCMHSTVAQRQLNCLIPAELFCAILKDLREFSQRFVSSHVKYHSKSVKYQSTHLQKSFSFLTQQREKNIIEINSSRMIRKKSE